MLIGGNRIRLLAAAALCWNFCLSLPAQEKKDIVVGLSEKERVPDVRLKTGLGDPFKLRPALIGKWTVLFYFRGNWCPYGRRQIKEIRTLENDLLDENVDVLGISPEGFPKTATMSQEFQTGFVLLSDENFDAGLSMGLMEALPLKDSDTYLNAGACLMELAQGGYLIPRTGLWLINPEGRVSYAHLPVDPKNILPAEELMKVVRQEKAKAKLKIP